MNTVGIICEYNPFHLGHQRQIRILRDNLEDDCAVVCVMSGNYVQRGMPAMWDKFTRARVAMNCGADLVLEMPVTGVLQSAEGFASTGVEILSKLGCVDYLSFGIEKGDGHTFLSMAKQLDTEEFQEKLRAGLDEGLSYAAARQQALDDHDGLLSTPNNILAFEYCRAILQQESKLKTLSVIRNSNYHDTQPQENEPSATAVRSLYPDGNWQDYVPKRASVLKDAPWYDVKFGERAVLSRLRALTDEEWEACAHGSEGLWRKAMAAARSESNLEAIINATKSKRYPRTRIQRLLLCAYLGITNEQLKQPFPYVRILAATEVGRTLLRQAKNNDAITLINPGQTPPNKEYYMLECQASRLYSLFAAPGHKADAQMEENGRLLLK